jgi:hypothetical protein
MSVKEDKAPPSAADERAWATPVRRTWRRILSRPGVRSVVFAFTLTRLIIFFIFILATNLSFDEPVRDFGPGVQEPRISLASTGVAQKLGRALLYADGLWYANIARDGYERQPFDAKAQHTWAFFPLYPLLLRAASGITGEYALTGSLLSNLFLFFALVLLHPTVRAFGYDEGCADRTIFYIAAFPTGYFFSLPVTESLFLLLTVGCFLAARRGHWWLTGILGALATATRPTGILIFPALLVQYFETYRREKLWRREMLALLLVPLGLFAFMFYLQRTTGDALAFLKVQAAWGHRAGFFLRPLLDYLTNPLLVSVRWDFRLVNFAAAVTALACGLVLLKRRQWSLAIYTLTCVIAPLSSMALQSMSRYFLTIFPAFIILALAGRRTFLDQSMRAVFLALLALMTALFAVHFSTAMS